MRFFAKAQQVQNGDPLKNIFVALRVNCIPTKEKFWNICNAALSIFFLAACLKLDFSSCCSVFQV